MKMKLRKSLRRGMKKLIRCGCRCRIGGCDVSGP